MPMQDDANDDDGQSMIVQGSLVDKPNEPKRLPHMFLLVYYLLLKFINYVVFVCN